MSDSPSPPAPPHPPSLSSNKPADEAVPTSGPSSAARTPAILHSSATFPIPEHDSITTSPAPSSPSSSSYLGSMWTGLIRRFSSEDGQFGSQVDGSLHHSHHSQAEQHHHYKDGVNGVFQPAVRRATPFRPPPLEPLVLHGYRDSTPTSARLLTNAVAEEIRAMVPERLRIVEDWHLVYSLEQDGASLATLYQKCRQYERRRVGFVLVVKDQEGGAFGAYLSEYPHPAPSYFGNGECFLWRASTLASLPPPPSADTTNLTRHTTLAPPPRPESAAGSGASTPSESIRFKAFPYSGLNDCYINCEAGYLSVGSGGGHYGLWLDDSLDIGHSSQCETFGNEPLSDAGEKFGVLGVELWVLGA
ncbi:oxidation resistance protein 1 [Purpureocillium takamizusanense]|uniref:Oxidation resistance protein 1 n=1 Tax=Purpureocillium takamizusanense TaxID=2060973 RepID=A0A9Q8VA16_9HYPO|nr:oxidation resistance protein 1 [Purpureocillium takamizusanense]UNI17357.1 oxidation resistance protein 1 [Purpureocillium takamizusanense]